MTATLRDLGYNLRTLRLQAGLYQGDLASLVGVVPSAISHYENAQREPSLSTALRLAQALDTTLDTLCGERLIAPSRRWRDE